MRPTTRPGEFRLGDVTTSGLLERRRAESVEPDVARCALTVMAPAGSDAEVVVSEVPTLRWDLPAGEWRASWFASQWGDEFSPHTARVGGAAGPLRLGVRTGRSSKGMHPWLCLEAPGHGAVVVSPAWSGNWAIDVVPDPGGGVTVTAGISPWKFSRRVSATKPFVAPDVYVAWGADRADAGAALARAAGRWIVPRSAWADSLPAEWNHWWPYEDAEIDADTFVENARIAGSLGFDLATCDAGWFGRPDAATFWERERGDWDTENTARFPGGLLALADDVRAAGTGFGVWIEAEAIGVDARLNDTHPSIVARRDDDPPAAPHEMPDPEDPAWLGYVCLGSPEGREHLRGVLERLIARTDCRWIKWDFNLDPGAGCSRTDHGHDAGDGLYEHYLGLYAILDEFRTRYPGIVWEACSSGGLRIDLGLAARFHALFLSDPDWTEFHLQLLWGASGMLPASAMLHFSESQWRTHHGSQNLDPATLDVATFDLAMRAVALHRFAVSYKLPEFSAELRDRLAGHLATYREWIAPLVASGAVVRPLTPQPRRDGQGERFPVFQLDAAASPPARVVLGAYRLDGAASETLVRPVGLDPETRYAVVLLGPGAEGGDVRVPGDLRDDATGGDARDASGTCSVATGAALVDAGLAIVADGPARSWLITLEPVGHHGGPNHEETK